MRFHQIVDCSKQLGAFPLDRGERSEFHHEDDDVRIRNDIREVPSWSLGLPRGRNSSFKRNGMRFVCKELIADINIHVYAAPNSIVCIASWNWFNVKRGRKYT